MPFNLLNGNGSIQLDDTLMGPSSSYNWEVLNDWNPFTPPDFREKTNEYLWDWGGSGGLDTYGTRKLKWTVLIRGTSHSTFQSRLQELMYRFSPATSEMELAFQIGSDGYTYFGRPRGAELLRYDNGRFMGWVECRWEALDPRYYSNTTTTVNHAAQSLSLPFNFGIQAGLLSASAPTPWQMVISANNGTTIRPRVYNPNGAEYVRFDDGGAAIPNGKEVYFDSRTRTAIYRNVDNSSPIPVDHLMDYTNLWRDFQAWSAPSIGVGRDGGTATTYTLTLTYRKAFI